MSKTKLLVITFPFKLNQTGYSKLKESLGKMTAELDIMVLFLENDTAPGYQFFYCGVEPEITITQDELIERFNPIAKSV